MKKSFFAERTEKEIEALKVTRIYRARGLVDTLLTLDPTTEALIVQQPLLPPAIMRRDIPQSESAKMWFKHGTVIKASQPRTQQDAYDCKEIPVAMRKRDLDSLQLRKEETIFDVGYSWFPVQGPDRRTRKDFFCFVPDSLRLFAYAETKTGGIVVTPYDDARKVGKEGARIICTVPSRTKKQPRYTVELVNVPTEGITERRAIPWGIRAEYGKAGEPLHKTFSFGYKYEHDNRSSDVYLFAPHERAAYIGVIREFWKGQNNLTPLEMNPFMLLSKEGAEFSRRAHNNLLIYDPTTHNFKGGLRKPYLAEHAILMARLCAIKGHDATFYWDPERDGKLKDYNWSIPQKENK